VLVLRVINELLQQVFWAQRRVDPYFRDTFDRLFRAKLTALVQSLVVARLPVQHAGLAEEQPIPDEDRYINAIADQMSAFMRKYYTGRHAERAGNTKTYGVVRGEFEILPDLPPTFRQGVFRENASYRAWVRFGGPGPFAPADIKDNGVLSIGVKLMGVPGEKLLDDECWTVDLTGISVPTFTSPNVVENLKLQQRLFEEIPLFYFINPFDSHFLDLFMSALYSRVQHSPLESSYWSCVPYLWGSGKAAQFRLSPRSSQLTPIPKNPPDDYLRDAMRTTLARSEWVFDFAVQLQTDPQRMPIENASVIWPEPLSPFVNIARLRLPPQTFDSQAQLAFADKLSFNPWHTVAEHRPLGNQSRARKHIYLKLSLIRQEMNHTRHVEPTGAEVF
jgi:hypothetical protein